MRVFGVFRLNKCWCNGFGVENFATANDHISVRGKCVVRHDLNFDLVVDGTPVEEVLV